MYLKKILYNLMRFLCIELFSDFFLTAKSILSLVCLKAIHELLDS